jgi:hypothetical protein
MNADEKIGAKQAEVEATLPENLIPVFRKLAAEYKFIAHVQGAFPWVAYKIIAELVRGGWRPIDEVDPGCLLERKM